MGQQRHNLIDWGDLGNEQPAIVVEPEVGKWETDFRLPVLNGTARQVAWARNIRRQMLGAIFPAIIGVTASIIDPRPVYQALDDLRVERSARVWIERHRLQQHQPIIYVLLLGTLVEEEGLRVVVNDEV